MNDATPRPDVLAALAAANATLARAEATCLALDEGWPPLGELPPESPAVPTLAPELLPEPLRPWLEDVAGRVCVPLDMAAVPAIVGLAAIVGRQVGIEPEPLDAWTVTPNLWGAIVARPGLFKTYVLSEGLSPLHRLAERAREAFEEAATRNEARRLAAESRLAAAKKRGKESEILAALEDVRAAKVTARRYVTQDPTTEKLGEILRDNPRGVLLARDELAGWLRTLDRPGREGDRELYLESWNGDGSFTVDRIGRGTLHIPSLCLSIVGGIQPGKLRQYVAEAVTGQAGADGLLQRIQVLVWPDDIPEWKPLDRPPAFEARELAAKIFERLDAIDLGAVGATLPPCGRLPVVRFSAEAQGFWTSWRASLETRLRGEELKDSPAFAAHAAKYRSLLPTLALLFDLAEWAAYGAFGTGVSLHSVERAANWCTFLEAHARKVYAEELHPETRAAQLLAERICAGSVRDGDSLRWIWRHHWSGLDDPDAVACAVRVLERRGWCRHERIASDGGRPREVLRLHPELRADPEAARKIHLGVLEPPCSGSAESVESAPEF